MISVLTSLDFLLVCLTEASNGLLRRVLAGVGMYRNIHYCINNQYDKKSEVNDGTIYKRSS